MAQSSGLCAIAITDHETTTGALPAQRAAKSSEVLVVPGVEISAESRLGEIHILGYFVEPERGDLEAKLHEMREARLRRARLMVKKLATLGMPVSWQRVRALAPGESVGRPHIARALLEQGYVASIDEAFAQYIGSGGPAYVSHLKVPPANVIAMIRRAGGVPVLAHPLRIADIVPSLLAAGLQGLEASYTGYTPEEVRYLEDIARRHGLVATGGSDFHGPGLACAELGAATTAFSTVEELWQRRPAASARAGPTGATK